jgi:hypothetical protein
MHSRVHTFLVRGHHGPHRGSKTASFWAARAHNRCQHGSAASLRTHRRFAGGHAGRERIPTVSAAKRGARPHGTPLGRTRFFVGGAITDFRRPGPRCNTMPRSARPGGGKVTRRRAIPRRASCSAAAPPGNSPRLEPADGEGRKRTKSRAPRIPERNSGLGQSSSAKSQEERIAK